MTLITVVAVVLVTGPSALGLFRSLISIRWAEHRRWPPPPGTKLPGPLRQRARSAAASLGVPVLGVLDWNSFVFGHPLRFAIAILLIFLGGIAGRAHRTLGTSESLGFAPPGGELVLQTKGPYAITRNPQYIGAVPVYLGVAVGTNSLLALIATAVMTAGLVANVFAEESWMRERFGEAYEDYCRQVPRFLPNLSPPRPRRS